jgi:hypothetical protein
MLCFLQLSHQQLVDPTPNHDVDESSLAVIVELLGVEHYWMAGTEIPVVAGDVACFHNEMDDRPCLPKVDVVVR